MMTDENKRGAVGIYAKPYRVLAADSDLYQRLRPDRLLVLLQEASIAHTIELGFPRQTTLDRGFLWMITRMHIQLKRPIHYDDEITIESWPEPMMHILYPRGYRILDSAGETLMEATAIWALIDIHSRRIAFPSKTGVNIPGITVDGELPIPEALPSVDRSISPHTTRAALYSELDLNGHVNNARYISWAHDLLSPAWHREHFFRDLQINFISELSPESIADLYGGLSEDGSRFALDGYSTGEDRLSFQIRAGIGQVQEQGSDCRTPV